MKFYKPLTHCIKFFSTEKVCRKHVPNVFVLYISVIESSFSYESERHLRVTEVLPDYYSGVLTSHFCGGSLDNCIHKFTNISTVKLTSETTLRNGAFYILLTLNEGTRSSLLILEEAPSVVPLLL